MSAVPDSVCVVGGGLAAVSTAAELRAQGFTGRVTLLSAEEHPPYDRPPLSKDVLLGRITYDEAALRPAQWYTDHDIDLYLGERVVSLDPAGPTVLTERGEQVRAGAVVLATGGVPRRLPAALVRPERTHVLRTLDDARGLRAALAPGTRVLCVGAGLIGAEAAAAAGALGASVTVIDPVGVPLVPLLGEQIATALHGLHHSNGVRTLQGALGQVHEGSDGTLTCTVDTAGGPEKVTADVLLTGIGTDPDPSLAADAGLETDRGVLVDARRATSAPGVYAVGDLAQAHPGTEERPQHGEHWENALKDAGAAAASILGNPVPAQGAPWFWSDRHGVHLEAVGTMSEADHTVVRGDVDSGSFTVFGLRGDRCVAAASLDRPHDIRAARRLVDRAVPVEADALADIVRPLKSLLRRPAAVRSR
ncbi:FAD-dependent oxidoreductase [Nocardiopsis sp. HNM0947]|uniref:FAD-dependent oxidoreductase n=1 Tax=Nocardiopsis coralli TaxID=2772213 RepID=A0ABR9P127_9ACTN|nr:FAD-dependent oxidoreductase [Nocardiopsis coralli]MBE2997523.1 FAD-dependent oxidoreductase [Nocardiopsis coralli]